MKVDINGGLEHSLDLENVCELSLHPQQKNILLENQISNEKENSCNYTRRCTSRTKRAKYCSVSHHVKLLGITISDGLYMNNIKTIYTCCTNTESNDTRQNISLLHKFSL